jgi:hypothetical protein
LGRAFTELTASSSPLKRAGRSTIATSAPAALDKAANQAGLQPTKEGLFRGLRCFGNGLSMRWADWARSRGATVRGRSAKEAEDHDPACSASRAASALISSRRGLYSSCTGHAMSQANVKRGGPATASPPSSPLPLPAGFTRRDRTLGRSWHHAGLGSARQRCEAGTWRRSLSAARTLKSRSTSAAVLRQLTNAGRKATRPAQRVVPT